jgi:hypothetical protein
LTSEITRRKLSLAAGVAAGAVQLGLLKSLLADSSSQLDALPFRTPYKHEKLVLGPSSDSAAFDSKSVDDPFVFYHEGTFKMLYIGFDGTGYQTGLARSQDLVNWQRVACVAKRDPNSRYTRYNIALSCIVRENELTSAGKLKKIRGRYLGAWNAYPSAGLEEGAAVIGLAWSDDLLHWELTEPVLFPADGAPWEHGGLYRPNLIEEDGTFYLYYNAKTDPNPHAKDGAWREQTGVATSRDLKHWTRYAGNPILRNGPAGAPDSHFASNPFVLRDGKLWGMYYFGLDDKGRAQELLALGHDPYHFAKVNEVMINVGKPGTVDETYAHKPSAISHDGKLYHFYCAVSGKWPDEVRGVSVACSKPW